MANMIYWGPSALHPGPTLPPRVATGREPLHDRRVKYDAVAAKRAAATRMLDGDDDDDMPDSEFFGGGDRRSAGGGKRRASSRGEEDELYLEAKVSGDFEALADENS